MAHAELDAATITTSSPQTSLSSYSPPSAAAILASATQQIRHQSAESARSCGNVAIALQRRKTVYFTVGQRQEVAIFEDYTPSEDIKSKLANGSENQENFGSDYSVSDVAPRKDAVIVWWWPFYLSFFFVFFFLI